MSLVLFLRLLLFLSLLLSIYQSIYLSIYLSISLSLSIYLSIYLFICIQKMFGHRNDQSHQDVDLVHSFVSRKIFFLKMTSLTKM